MSGSRDGRPLRVMGPCGEAMGLDDLPPHDTIRWVARRKAEVVYAVNGGLLKLDDALALYGLTMEEFTSWQRHVDRSGLRGLRVTHLQEYRTHWASENQPLPA